MPYDTQDPTPQAAALLLDVPFVAHTGYAGFLAENAHRLASVHYGLGEVLGSVEITDADDASACAAPDKTLDARHAGPESRNGADGTALLAGLRGPRKYALLNAAFQQPAFYLAPDRVHALAATLEALVEAEALDGVVFTDFYLLHALARTAPLLCRVLDASPGVHCGIDTPAKARAVLAALDELPFRPPAKIVLDRSLNRDFAALRATAAACREVHAEIVIDLLANEGCLPHCPFARAHGAHITYANLHPEQAAGHRLHRELGCVHRVHEEPSLLFASPFIRPEDQARYQGVADAIKVCGRTRGAAYLRTAVAAYLSGSFSGNLLWLNDATEGLSGTLEVRNEELPADFLDRVADCGLRCATCRRCDALAAAHVREIEPGDALSAPGA